MRLKIALFLALLAAGGCQERGVLGASGTLLIKNALIYTIAEGETDPRDAMCIRAGTILFVGALNQAEACAGPNPKTIDAGGRAIIPGFIVALPTTEAAQLEDVNVSSLGITSVVLEKGASASSNDAGQNGQVRFFILSNDDEDALPALNTQMMESLQITLPKAPAPRSWASLKIAPFNSIKSDVTNGARESVVGPVQPLTVFKSVESMTRDQAIVLGLDDFVGTLEAGKSADFVILSQDIFSVPADQIDQTKPLLTALAGTIVYDAAQEPR